MKTKVVIFDKDGTLIDFDAFWVSLAQRAFEWMTEQLGRTDIGKERYFELLGVKNGVADIDGILCMGTYRQMGDILHDVLTSNGYDISADEALELTLKAYDINACYGTVKPTCENLKETLTDLKAQGIRLAVVTTDNELITKHCLDKLGITQLFDRIYTDDKKTPVKPDPFCALDFCRRFGIDMQDAVMVGDTATDITFARNAGMRVVAVAKNNENKKRMEPLADIVVSEISQLLEVLE